MLLGLGAVPLAFVPRGRADEPAALASWTVILVRHSEKGTDDARDPGLSEVGTARAEALASLLAGAGVQRVFSTDYVRTRSTAGPVAKASEVEIELYDPRDTDDIVKTLTALESGTVALVVGHSNTTPGLLQALGAEEPAGLEDSRHGRILPDDCYDRLYVAQFIELEGEDAPRLVSSLDLRYG